MTVTAREVTVIVKDAVDSLGGGFMISQQARQTSKESGLRGWELYFAGRGGVLGDVPAELVAAVLAFFPVDFVRSRWDAARRKMPPVKAVECFAAACEDWGRDRLSGFGEAGRLAGLMEKVTGNAQITGLPLFTGWSAVPVAADPAARLARAAHLLREHRGGLHVMAVLATGLTPLQAIVAGPYGAENARFFQWAEPYPALTDGLRQHRALAEDLTDDMAALAYAALTDAESAEFVDLVSEAQRAAFSSSG
jgi:hypothetical protein